VGRLFEILVRKLGASSTVGYLFTLAIHFTLTFTRAARRPGGRSDRLSRMSSDGEITAMRAAGIPSRKVIAPVLTFCFDRDSGDRDRVTLVHALFDH